MSDTPPNASLNDEERRLHQAVLARDRARRARLAERLVPGLPVGPDPAELRVATPAIGSLVDGIVGALLVDRSGFFERAVEAWDGLFPGMPARPGRFDAVSGRFFVYVRSSGALFALRSRRAAIRKALAALEGAPKKFDVHWEIHAR